MSQQIQGDQNKHAIQSDPIDRVLASEEPILPSYGFLAAVMERVQEESRVPAPIPFPWKRAIPGAILATGVFGWGAYEFIYYGISVRSLTLPQLNLDSAATSALEQAGWVGLALAASLFCWKLSSRLSGQS